MDVIYTDEGSAHSSETLVRNYQITLRLIPVDGNLMTQAKLYKLGSRHSVVKQTKKQKTQTACHMPVLSSMARASVKTAC